MVEASLELMQVEQICDVNEIAVVEGSETLVLLSSSMT